MVDSPNRVGPTGGQGLGSLARLLGIGSSPSRSGTTTQGNAANAQTPKGRGQRVLSADASIDDLDRSAPRGTYLDILA